MGLECGATLPRPSFFLSFPMLGPLGRPQHTPQHGNTSFSAIDSGPTRCGTQADAILCVCKSRLVSATPPFFMYDRGGSPMLNPSRSWPVQSEKKAAAAAAATTTTKIRSGLQKCLLLPRRALATSISCESSVAGIRCSMVIGW